MIIIGEKINTSAKRVKQAVEGRDVEFIRRLALEQVEAGAHCLDVSVSAAEGQEIDNLKWVLEIVEATTSVPICIDSPNPETVVRALELTKRPAIVNSITAQASDSNRQVLHKVAETGSSVIILAHDDRSIPNDPCERLASVEVGVKEAHLLGIPDERILVDPLVFPVGVDDQNAVRCLDTLALVKSKFPNVRTVCAVSNVSFGLPARSVWNQAFLAMLIARGLDAAILDPLDPGVMTTLRTAVALRGEDEYLQAWLKEFRKAQPAV